MKYLRHTARYLGVLLIAASLLNACGTSNGGAIPEEDLTPAQRSLRERDAAFQKTVWEGALLGAGLGAITGFIFGGKDKGKSVLIGATAGIAVGALTGAYIGSKQNEYADREEQLDAVIADVRQKNTEAEAVTESMKEVIAEDRRKLDLANQQFAQKEISESEYQGQLNLVRQDREVMAGSINSAEEQLETFREAQMAYEEDAVDAQTAQLKDEIDVLQTQISTMHDIVGDLSAAELG